MGDLRKADVLIKRMERAAKLLEEMEGVEFHWTYEIKASLKKEEE